MDLPGVELSADTQTPDEENQSHPVLEVGQRFRDIVNRLEKFFTVTEEERTNAGIGTKRRD
jgi:hypothetical protein